MHEFQKEGVLSKDFLVGQHEFTSALHVVCLAGFRDLSFGATRERDNPLSVLAQEIFIHARLVIESLEVGNRNEGQQILVALHGFCEERQVERVRVDAGTSIGMFVGSDVSFDAQDWFQPCLMRCFVELDRAVQGVVVGERNGVVPHFLGTPNQILDAAHGVVEREHGVRVKMDERALGKGSSFLGHTKRFADGTRPANAWLDELATFLVLAFTFDGFRHFTLEVIFLVSFFSFTHPTEDFFAGGGHHAKILGSGADAFADI